MHSMPTILRWREKRLGRRLQTLNAFIAYWRHLSRVATRRSVASPNTAASSAGNFETAAAGLLRAKFSN